MRKKKQDIRNHITKMIDASFEEESEMEEETREDKEKR
jgi:hypothetical protein